MKLEPVEEEHYKFLYRLLSQREPHQNISHQIMPTFSAHVNFVDSHPYAEWYVIVVDDLYVGSIYLTKAREIGLFIDRKYRRAGLGTIALNKLIQRTHVRPLYANISPNNPMSEEFFKRNEFKFLRLDSGPNNKTLQVVYNYTITPSDFYGARD